MAKDKSKKIRNFLKDGMVYGVGGVLTRFVGVFTAPVYTRFLDTDGFGKLDLATTIGAILIILVGMSMNSGYSRSYYESKESGNLNTLTGTILLYLFTVGVGVLLIGLFLSDKIAFWLEGVEGELLVPIFANVLPLLIISLVQVMLRFEKKPVSYVVVTISNVGLTGLCGILAVVWLKAGVLGVVWSNAIVSYVIALPSLFLMYRYTRFKLNFSYFRETFSYSAPIMPARIGSWVKEYASRFFIIGALSLSSLGIYSFAIKIALILKLAENAFKLTWTPRQVQLYGEKNSEPIFARILNYYMLTFFLICIFITALSPLAVLVLATPAFYSSTTLVGLLCVAYLWDGSVNILAAGNNWSRKTYYNSIGSITAGLTAIFILWVGIERWGLIVASLALLMSSIVKSLLILWTAQINHKIPYSYKNLFYMVFSSILFSITSYFIFDNDALSMTMAGITVFLVGILLFFILLFLMFTPKKREQMFNLINKNIIKRQVQL